MKKLTTLAKKKLVISALEEIKARDIQAIDVRKLTAMFDWIVVASAESARQTKSLSRHVRDRLAEFGAGIVGTEGEESGEWVLVDAGDIVAHVMQPAVREYYNLEELWGEGKFDKVVASSQPVKTVRRKKAAAPPAARAKRKAPAPRRRA
jgi:ribosome-associated protein